MKRVRIIEYQAGNLLSVARAFEYLGCVVELAGRPEQIAGADSLVLPGVGAFGDGISSLRERELVEPILAYIATGKPFLGICLGMQLLLDSSQEFGQHQGLGVIPGVVTRLPSQPGVKLPNIGWHPLFPRGGESESAWAGTILSKVATERDMYFVHSYYCIPNNSEVILSFSSYKDTTYCSSISWKNIFACQFHPEKSAKDGLQVYKNLALRIKSTRGDIGGENRRKEIRSKV